MPPKRSIDAAAAAAAAPASKRKRKDPNAPKHPLSAFMLFSNATRERVRREQPSLSFRDMGHTLGKLWGALDERGRAPFQASADALKATYKVEKARYTPAPPAADAGAPKQSGLPGGKPMTALHLFAIDHELAVRGGLADPSDLGAVAKALCTRYAALTPAEHASYESRALVANAGGAKLMHALLPSKRRKPRALSDERRTKLLKKHAELVEKRQKLASKLASVSGQLAGVCHSLQLAPPASLTTALLAAPATTAPAVASATALVVVAPAAAAAAAVAPPAPKAAVARAAAKSPRAAAAPAGVQVAQAVPLAPAAVAPKKRGRPSNLALVARELASSAAAPAPVLAKRTPKPKVL